MHINKNSWHYHLYVWTYKQWSSENLVPKQTNLCQYTQRLLWMSLLYVLMGAFMWGVIFPLWTLIGIPIGWLLGYKPTTLNLFEADQPMVPYEPIRLPVYGSFIPIHAVGIAVLVFLEWLWFHYCGWQTPVAVQGDLLGVFAIIFGLVVFSDSELSRVVSAWFAARKQGLYPLVEFTEEPTSTNINE